MTCLYHHYDHDTETQDGFVERTCAHEIVKETDKSIIIKTAGTFCHEGDKPTRRISAKDLRTGYVEVSKHINKGYFTRNPEPPEKIDMRPDWMVTLGIKSGWPTEEQLRAAYAACTAADRDQALEDGLAALAWVAESIRKAV